MFKQTTVTWYERVVWDLGGGLLVCAALVALFVVASHNGQTDISKDTAYDMRVAHPGGALTDAKTFRYCDGRQFVLLDWEWGVTYTGRPCEKKPTE